MKVLTTQEPYASLIREGFKAIETRSWKTNYRGPLAIHASAKPHDMYFDKKFNIYLFKELKLRQTRCGVIHCVANLIDCIEIDDEFLAKLSPLEKSLGFYEKGRFAWILNDVHSFDVNDQKVIKGHLGIWNFKED